VLGLDITRIAMTSNPQLAKAQTLFQLGQYQFALDDLERATLIDDDEIIYDLLKGEIRKRLQDSDRECNVTLVWRIGRNCWEGDWLRHLLCGIYGSEVDGAPDSGICRKLIVVDNRLDITKADWYRQQYKNGAQICLIHLSDEHFRDAAEAIYRWCALVYRNYFSPLYSECATIKALPLGTKLGFALDANLMPASQRKWTWGFAGDIKKSTRQQMIEQMNRIPNGGLHLTSGFASSDSLQVEQYEAFLRNCVFGPCPSGNVNIDSFRVYECLESGTIPIMEMRDHFDYLKELLGPHPVPTIDRWDEAPRLVDSTVRNGNINRVQADCIGWWRAAKASLRARLHDDIFCHLKIDRPDKARRQSTHTHNDVATSDPDAGV
jgi:hypothetical protein